MAAVRIHVVRITAVDNDVAFGQQRLQLIDHSIDGGSRLDHNHDSARCRQTVDECCQRVVAFDAIRHSRFDNSGRPTAKATYKFVSRLRRAVVDADGKSFVGHVHDQILTHNRQADQADIVL